MCSNPHLVQMSQVVYGFLIAVGSIPPKIRTMCHIATGCVRCNGVLIIPNIPNIPRYMDLHQKPDHHTIPACHCHDVRTASLAESSRDDIMYKNPQVSADQIVVMSLQNPPPPPRAEIIMIKLLPNGMEEVDIACGTLVVWRTLCDYRVPGHFLRKNEGSQYMALLVNE